MPRNDSALLDGQPVFGDPPSFVAAPLVGGPASLDTFLGNAPGTTSGPSQQMYALSGKFIAPTSAAVTAQIAALQAMAGLSYPFGYPTGLRFPDDFRWSPRWCYFLTPEFKPGTVTQVGVNTWAATFLIVLRQCGGS